MLWQGAIRSIVRSVHRPVVVSLPVAALAASAALLTPLWDRQYGSAAAQAPHDAPKTAPGGRVLGFIETRHGAASIALPGATVALENPSGEAVGAPAQSDVEGHYEIPSHGPGIYRLCSRKPGFAPTCAAEPAVINADTGFLSVNLTLRAEREAVHGRVVLADGSPCYQRTSAFGTAVAAEVTLSGPGADITSSGNKRGEFVLAGSFTTAGKRTLKARCQRSEATRTVILDSESLNGRRSEDLVLPNSPPVIRALYARDMSGHPLRAFSPGQRIEVVAEVVDPDTGDDLTFKWTDGGRGLTPVNAPKIVWTLPATEGRSFLNLEVGDGKGGFASDQLSVGTSDTGARFIGKLLDPGGKPATGAMVSVDGHAATVDGEGNFRAAVPIAERHVLTVDQPGHAPIAKVFHDAAPGLSLTVKPATRLRVDPSRPIRVSEQGVELTIEPGQLVGADGQRPNGQLNADIHRYDVNGGEFPGDPAAVAADESETGFIARDAVAVDITDDTGKKYDLAPGGTAQLAFPAPPAADPSLLPPTMTLARYDMAKGLWTVRTEAGLAGQRSYAGRIGHLSVWSLGQLSGDTACVRVVVDPFQLDRPFNLRVAIPPAASTGIPEIRQQTVTQTQDIVARLPPNRLTVFSVTPVGAPDRPMVSRLVGTGANVSPAIPPFPYTACGGFIKLAVQLPTKVWLNRGGNDDDNNSPGKGAFADAYYKAIGARPLKDTFAKWRAANGFDINDAPSEVVFFNPNELGLGRKVDCRRSTSHEACYVTKYGTVGGSPSEAFDDTIHGFSPGDTVAMESDRVTPGKPEVVRFYIYDPGGKLTTSTHFDPSGPAVVPGACMSCHGSGPGQFVVLDPHAYQFPGVAKNAPQGLDQQQEKFRVINEAVAFQHQHAGPYYELLSSLYPDSQNVGVHKPGTKAIRAPTPPAWKDDAFLYENVIKPSCRTCHMWQNDAFSGRQPGSLDHAFGFNDDICLGSMPNAMSPMLRLWKTTDPNLIQAWADAKTSGGFDCGSIPAKGTPPNLTVVEPSGSVGYGGLNIVTHKASVSDAEDQATCCDVVWSSDVDGRLGVGKAIEFTYATPGPRVITAVATDKDGRVAAKTFPLLVTNQPPSIRITAPDNNNATFIQNQPVVLQGRASDPNEVSLPCSSLRWTSTHPSDVGQFPFTGCTKTIAFSGLGLRTLTLTGIDRDGANAITARPVNVTALPPKSPPIVTILEPNEGNVLDPALFVHLRGAVNVGADPVTFRWTVQPFSTEIDLGSFQDLFWQPQNNVPFHCGGTNVVVRLYATNANGTGTMSVTNRVSYPVC